MINFSKFSRIMSWLVMIVGVVLSIVIAIMFFVTAGNSYKSIAPIYVWSGIIILIAGSVFSVGIFALWNMLIAWYDNSCRIKSKYCGDPMPTQYGVPVQPMPAPVQPAPAPVQHSANWYCPQCGTANDAVSGFCANCGQRR